MSTRPAVGVNRRPARRFACSAHVKRLSSGRQWYTADSMPNNSATKNVLTREFDRQVSTLLQKRYPEITSVPVDEFMAHMAPLKERVRGLYRPGEEAKEGRIPFVIVIKGELMPAETAMPLIEINGTRGFVGMHPVEPCVFRPIDSVAIPDGVAYLLVDIDTGRGTLNVTPDDAMNVIEQEDRSPLTIDEGVALLTHYPDILRTHNCFSLLGSRCGDRRVTALWISGGRPRLGWCWAGNPHTWLGSASCRRRVGAEPVDSVGLTHRSGRADRSLIPPGY